VRGQEQALDQIRKALASTDDRKAKAAQAAALIRGAGDYRWAGIYEVGADEIAAIAWTGADAPAFPRFPKTKGLCGAAVSAGATVVVGDVAKDPRYLTTFGSTKSEIAVPIVSSASKATVGLIDVESEQRDAFDDSDRTFLESCAGLLTGLWE